MPKFQTIYLEIVTFVGERGSRSSGEFTLILEAHRLLHLGFSGVESSGHLLISQFLRTFSSLRHPMNLVPTVGMTIRESCSRSNSTPTGFELLL